MSTLPRFRLPDESSSHDVSRLAAAGAWEDFDDLDQLETRVRSTEREAEFDVIPTVVRPSLGRKTLARAPLRAVKAANVDDVVEELRAAAAGRAPRVREVASSELLEDAPEADVMDVEEGELVFDRAVPQRNVWNVRQVAGPGRPSIVGPTPAPSSRFVLTAALAMLVGALLAISAALVVWRFSGLTL
jgi:hypothetical protein